MNITELIFAENAGHAGDAVVEGGRTVTYPELFAAIRSVASELDGIGVGSGTTVALCLRGGIDYIILSLAVLLRGGVLVPIIETAGEAEISHVAEAVGAELILTTRRLSANHQNDDSGDWGRKPPTRIGREAGALSDSARGTCGSLGSSANSPQQALHAAALSKLLWVSRLAPSAPLDPRIRALDAAFVRFSSGTTGASKGVVLSHHAIRERTDAADRALRMTRGDRVIWVLNMSFHFVVTILLFLRRGSTLVVCEDNFPGSFLQTVSQGLPTFLYASPFHYSLLTTAEGVAPDVFRRVRLAVSTAMSLSREVAEKFHAVFGIYPAQAYGIIEVGLPCVNTAQDPDKLLSVGRLLPDYQLKLEEADDQGRGRILLKGPGLFDAYLSPLRLAADALADGWFDTGDIGGFDPDGFLFITGRTKNVINFCGMKIFPEEVETVLTRFPGIAEARVFGRSHPQYGQIVCAELVAPEPVDLDELRVECYRQLAKYQVPKEFAFVPALPRTASGKIRRH